MTHSPLSGFFLLDLDKQAVLAFSIFRRNKRGKLPVADAVRVRNNKRFLRLPKYLREPNGRHDARFEQIAQYAARPDRRELVAVANKHDLGVFWHGFQEVMGENGVEHGNLVGDQHVRTAGGWSRCAENRPCRAQTQADGESFPLRAP